MKKISLALILAFALVFSGLQARKKTPIDFDCGDVYDWGIVKPNQSPLRALIKIRNPRGDTLKIKSVKPACGCTTAPLSKRIIPPGDSAVLRVTLNVKYYEGEIIKPIYFRTNRGKMELKLKANVYKPFSVFPYPYFNFAQMYVGDTTTSKVVVTNKSGRDVTIADVSIDPASELTVNVAKGDVIAKDSDIVVEARVIPTAAGRFTATVTILTDDPDEPEIKLRGWGSVAPASQKTVDLKKREVRKATKPTVKLGPPIEATPPKAKAKPTAAPGVGIQNPPKFRAQPVEPLPKSSVPAEIKFKIKSAKDSTASAKKK